MRAFGPPFASPASPAAAAPVPAGSPSSAEGALVAGDPTNPLPQFAEGLVNYGYVPVDGQPPYDGTIPPVTPALATLGNFQIQGPINDPWDVVGDIPDLEGADNLFDFLIADLMITGSATTVMPANLNNFSLYRLPAFPSSAVDAVLEAFVAGPVDNGFIDFSDGIAAPGAAGLAAKAALEARGWTVSLGA